MFSNSEYEELGKHLAEIQGKLAKAMVTLESADKLKKQLVFLYPQSDAQAEDNEMLSHIRHIEGTLIHTEYERNGLSTELSETQDKLDKAISYLKRINRADSMVAALVITRDALAELEDKYG